MKPPRSMAEIERLSDPIEQARDAEAFARYADAMAQRARTVRDAALRRALAELPVSRPKLAERTGVGVHTVKAVTR